MGAESERIPESYEYAVSGVICSDCPFRSLGEVDLILASNGLSSEEVISDVRRILPCSRVAGGGTASQLLEPYLYRDESLNAVEDPSNVGIILQRCVDKCGVAPVNSGHVQYLDTQDAIMSLELLGIGVPDLSQVETLRLAAEDAIDRALDRVRGRRHVDDIDVIAERYLTIMGAALSRDRRDAGQILEHLLGLLASRALNV